MLWQHLYPICIRFFEYTAWNLFRGFLVSLAFTQPGVDTVEDFFLYKLYMKLDMQLVRKDFFFQYIR